MDTKLNKRNCSIDVFKYICAWLVIAIHQKPFHDFGELSDYFSIEFLPRIAVPFFFVVSGYFLHSTIKKGKFLSYEKKLIVTYALWSFIYIAYEALKNIKDINITKATILELLSNIFIKGTAGHLWYLPALIYCSLIIFLLQKLKIKKIILPLSITVYVIGILGSGYSFIGKKTPIINSLYQLSCYSEIMRIFIFGFAFLSLGYSISCKNISPSKKLTNIALPIIFLLFIIEKLTIYKLFDSGQLLTAFLYPLSLLILTFLLNHPATKLSSISIYFRNAATFVYFSHLIIIDLLGHFVSNHIAWYILTGVVATIGSIIITKINNKYLNLFNG